MTCRDTVCDLDEVANDIFIAHLTAEPFTCKTYWTKKSSFTGLLLALSNSIVINIGIIYWINLKGTMKSSNINVTVWCTIPASVVLWQVRANKLHEVKRQNYTHMHVTNVCLTFYLKVLPFFFVKVISGGCIRGVVYKELRSGRFRCEMRRRLRSMLRFSAH